RQGERRKHDGSTTYRRPPFVSERSSREISLWFDVKRKNIARVVLVRVSAFSSSAPRTGTCRRKYHDTSSQSLASDQDRRATNRRQRTARGGAEVAAGQIRSRRMSVHSHG